MPLCLPSSWLRVVVDSLISHLSHSLENREVQYLHSPYNPFHTRFSQTNPVFKWPFWLSVHLSRLGVSKIHTHCTCGVQVERTWSRAPWPERAICTSRGGRQGPPGSLFSFLARVGAGGLQSACSGAVRGRSGERRSSFWRTFTEVGRARNGRRALAE